MKINHLKNKKLLTVISLMVILALLCAMIAVISSDLINAQAKTNRNLWKSNSSISIDKGKISTTSSSNSTATYGSALPSDLNLKFKVTSSNFDELSFSFTSYPSLGSASNSDIVNTLTLIKSKDSSREGKIDVIVNDQRKSTAAKLDIDFYNTDLTLNIEESNGEYYPTINGEKLTASAVMQTENITDGNRNMKFKQGSFAIPIISNLSMSFRQIDEDKTAEVTVSNIAGIDVSGEFADTNKPIIYLDKEVLPTKLIVGNDFKIPAYYYDLQDHSLTNVKLDVIYSETEDFTNGTALASKDIIVDTDTKKLSFSVAKEGYYKATLKVTDSEGNESEIEIKSFEDNTLQAIKYEGSNPLFVDNTVEECFTNANISNFVEKGQTIYFPRPVVKSEIALGVEQNPNKVKVALQTKTGNGEWTPSIRTIRETAGVNNLAYTPTTGGVEVRYVIVDECGNWVASDETFIILNVLDNIRPEVEILSFPETGYQNTPLTLPSAAVFDKGNSSPSKTIDVYYGVTKDTDGKYILDKEKMITKDTTTMFTPENLGEYVIVYTVSDNETAKVTEIRTVTIEKASKSPDSGGRPLTTLEITMIVIGSLCAVGIITLVVPFNKIFGNKKKAD